MALKDSLNASNEKKAGKVKFTTYRKFLTLEFLFWFSLQMKAKVHICKNFLLQANFDP